LEPKLIITIMHGQQHIKIFHLNFLSLGNTVPKTTWYVWLHAHVCLCKQTNKQTSK